MTATLYSIVFLAQTALGCAWGGHHDRPLVACCDVCGVETAEVFAEIRTLQADPRWRKRDNAAHELREFDWRCHPEILAVLTTALLTDCEEEVREEAAESLARIDPPPCTPEVHAALARAAVADPDHATRKDARRALARIGRHCVAPCSLCGPASPVGPVPTEVIIAPPRTVLPPGAVYEPPTTVLPPGTIVQPPTVVTPEPRFESDGLEPLPPPEPMPPGAVPPANVPPLPPGAIAPFDPTPEARRSIEDRISSRSTTPRDRDPARIASRSEEEKRDELPRTSSRRRPRLFPFSILGRRGR